MPPGCKSRHPRTLPEEIDFLEKHIPQWHNRAGRLVRLAAAEQAVSDHSSFIVEQGAKPVVLDLEDLRNFIAFEIKKWAAVIGGIGNDPM
jgi:hypothetical protein